MNLPKELLDRFKPAISKWYTNVYLRSENIDPGNERDWYDMALGFFLASGIPFESLEYDFLCDMTNDAVEEYVKLI